MLRRLFISTKFVIENCYARQIRQLSQSKTDTSTKEKRTTSKVEHFRDEKASGNIEFCEQERLWRVQWFLCGPRESYKRVSLFLRGIFAPFALSRSNDLANMSRSTELTLNENSILCDDKKDRYIKKWTFTIRDSCLLKFTLQTTVESRLFELIERCADKRIFRH